MVNDKYVAETGLNMARYFAFYTFSGKAIPVWAYDIPDLNKQISNLRKYLTKLSARENNDLPEGIEHFIDPKMYSKR